MGVYIGRFAPSPTGPLHFGSLVAALASYTEAKQANGKWLVRIEDLDTPRIVPGAADHILRTLDHFGLHWDGPVLYQSQRAEAYRDALSQLPTYPCACSRKTNHACHCRLHPPAGPHSLRLQANNAKVSFQDAQFGHFEQHVDDFVLRRADGLFTYQLAVVVDDAHQAITHIVRGSDLLDSTPRQILLQQLLGHPQPRYKHIPVVNNAAGEKLSKQTLAPALDWSQCDKLQEAAREYLNSCRNS